MKLKHSIINNQQHTILFQSCILIEIQPSNNLLTTIHLISIIFLFRYVPIKFLSFVRRCYIVQSEFLSTNDAYEPRRKLFWGLVTVSARKSCALLFHKLITTTIKEIYSARPLQQLATFDQLFSDAIGGNAKHWAKLNTYSFAALASSIQNLSLILDLLREFKIFKNKRVKKVSRNFNHVVKS